MTTCLSSIASMGSISSLTEVFPNTAMPFSATATANKLFRLQSPTFQTVTFSFALTGTFWNTILTVYRWDALTSTATAIGSVSIASGIVSFTLDFLAGDYILCLRPGTAVAQSGSFVASFVGYPQIANLRIYCYEGATAVAPVIIPPPPRVCRQSLFFKILEGTLPPGLVMNFQGTIHGLLPNLDCLPDSPSPAVNWYFTDNDGTVWPWGRMWRFYVKVWVDQLEDVSFAEEWFCVKIHNNWTFDLDNFKAQSPFTQIHHVRVVEEPKPLTVECAPCAEMEMTQFVPQPIAETPCIPCIGQTEAHRVELIPIPLELATVPTNDIVAWYLSNKDKPIDNPNIQKFIADLSGSDVFNILLSRLGYDGPTITLTQTEFVSLSTYQKYLQLAEIRLDPNMNPNNLAHLILQWQFEENQALPTNPIGYGGEEMNVSLT